MANALTTSLPLGIGYTIFTSNQGQLNVITAPGGAGGVTTVFGRTGDVVAQNNDYSTGQIANTSGLPGATLNNALARLTGDTPLDTGTGLTDASTVVSTPRRHVMLPGTTTAIRTKTLTPGAAGTGYLFEIGTQANNVIVVNGGPSSGGLFTRTVTAGSREAQYWVSDGTDVSLAVAMPLGAEPLI